MNSFIFDYFMNGRISIIMWNVKSIKILGKSTMA